MVVNPVLMNNHQLELAEESSPHKSNAPVSFFVSACGCAGYAEEGPLRLAPKYL